MGENYKAVFPGFYFCLIYPGLGAREADESETPKGAAKKSSKKSLLSLVKSQYLPYSGKNKLQPHLTSIG